jgi:hypothetical protein
VPEVKVTANDSNTFKPFNPSEAIGNTAPELPYIPPPPKDSCNPLVAILVVVVAVVVTVFTAGVAAVGMGAGFSAIMGAGATVMTGGLVAGGLAATTWGAVGAAVIGTTVGSAVSMGVGSALGQGSFSWRGVAASAVTSAITAGVGTALSGVDALHTVVGGVRQLNTAGRLVQGAVGYGASVVGNATAGLDTAFSWNAVAASAVGAVASAKLGGRVSQLEWGGSSGNFMKDATGYFINSASHATARRAMGLGNQDWDGMAVDAFGNALGNAVVGGIQRWQANRLAESQSPPASWQDLSPAQQAEFLDRHEGMTFGMGPAMAAAFPIGMQGPATLLHFHPQFQLTDDGYVLDTATGQYGSKVWTEDDYNNLMSSHSQGWVATQEQLERGESLAAGQWTLEEREWRLRQALGFSDPVTVQRLEFGSLDREPQLLETVVVTAPREQFIASEPGSVVAGAAVVPESPPEMDYSFSGYTGTAFGWRSTGYRIQVGNPKLTVIWESTRSAWTGKGGFTPGAEDMLVSRGLLVEASVGLPPPGSLNASSGVPSSVANNTNGALAERAICQRYQANGYSVVYQQSRNGGQRIVDVVATLENFSDPRNSSVVEIESKAFRVGVDSYYSRQADLDAHRVRENSNVRMGGRVLEGVGRVARPIGIVMDGYELGQSFAADGYRIGQNTGRSASGIVGGGLGGWGGAAAGAALGTAFFPGVGTVIGGLLGGSLGAWGGTEVSQGSFDYIYKYRYGTVEQ